MKVRESASVWIPSIQAAFVGKAPVMGSLGSPNARRPFTGLSKPRFPLTGAFSRLVSGAAALNGNAAGTDCLGSECLCTTGSEKQIILPSLPSSRYQARPAPLTSLQRRTVRDSSGVWPCLPTSKVVCSLTPGAPEGRVPKVKQSNRIRRPQGQAIGPRKGRLISKATRAGRPQPSAETAPI